MGSMSTQTITEFLEARLSEDEALASEALEDSSRWWVDGPAEHSGHWWVYATGAKFEKRQVATHIARHDPARVLAECAAKRKIVQYATGLRLDRARDAETDAQYRSVWWVLWQFATAYKSHPEYREDWEL